MAFWWFAIRPVVSERGWALVDQSFTICGEGPHAEACVIDGDTVIVGERAGSGSGQRRIRFTGFDAPELDGACDAETRLAEAARQRLYDWLSEGAFEWDGADDPPRDQYGRELRGARRVDPEEGEDTLAEVMITSGLAAGSGWGAASVDWCAE